MAFAPDTVGPQCQQTWRRHIVPVLHDYIRIPNVSPAYDPEWMEAGHMDQAVELVRSWCAARPIDGLRVEVLRLPGRTPLLWMEVPATPGAPADDTVVLYGHLDKQPAMYGWRAGLGPWEPVLQDDRLYGRGGADDGYAAFAALTAIEAVRAGGGEHVRIVVIIEASEESGSSDLPAYVDAHLERFGTPSLVVCLDSGCADYDRLWTTTSLRGVMVVRLRVDVLAEGVHSGMAGGIVPSSFRILRHLLSRLEDEATGRIVVPELHVAVPPQRAAEAEATAARLGGSVAGSFPWAGATHPMVGDVTGQILARTWAPTLAVVGMDGIPPGETAGNVLRPFTAATLSLRLPPTCDPVAAAKAVHDVLAADHPSGAQVTVEVEAAEAGWDAPATAPWLSAAVDEASRREWGQPAGSIGEGGTIPFMGMLGARFPDAQFLVTGVLGPGSNAHGPNEFLDLPTGMRVTAAVAHVLHAHATRS